MAPPQAVKMGFFGPMKTLDTARTSLEELPDGRLRASIEHATLAGVSIYMLRWWFEHIDTFTTERFVPTLYAHDAGAAAAPGRTR